MDHTHANLRVLGFFLSHRKTYRSPLFSGNEIFCGPDTDELIVDGRIRCLRAPVGTYDVGDITRSIPADQQPDLVIVKADSTQRNFPRNLKSFACPKVLLVGDTHHMRTPLQKVIAYAQSEPFDHIIFDHTRHHAHWFAKAGLRNLAWIPALDFGYVPREVRESRRRQLTFFGSTGKFHPWRREVISRVQKAGLPIEVFQGTLDEGADCYADSEITLNISLNGDLNLRVFEALGAGGFLLTDELSAASGLGTLFETGKHLDTWEDTDELNEKIRYYLAHPDLVTRIRTEAHKEMLLNHHPEVKLREFFDLVFNGKVNPRYDLGSDVAVATSLPSACVEPAGIRGLSAYEWIQEIHRTSASTTVYCSERAIADLGGEPDLPRLALRPHASLSPTSPNIPISPYDGRSQVLWLDATAGATPDLLGRFTGGLVIAPCSAAARLAEWGFHAMARSDESVGLYKMNHPVTFVKKAWSHGSQDTVRFMLPSVLATCATAEDCLELAKCALALAMKDIRVAALRRAVSLDRNCQAALIELAAVALNQTDNFLATMALEEARRCGPLPAPTDRVRIHLSSGHTQALLPYHTLVGRNPPERAEKSLRILVVTNLFPPQEMGGYGRMMWEFARGLRARGHAVSVLTCDAKQFARVPADDELDMEKRVSRSLALSGGWEGGRLEVAAPATRARIEAANASIVLREAAVCEPDLILVGNLDLLGVGLVQSAISAGYPVLHAIANHLPGFKPADQPKSPSYVMAPCSSWNGRAIRESGFEPSRMETLYPGARLDRFYRLFAPDLRTLRIAYASLVAPYKGTHVLVEALARLSALGFNFTAEIAGDAYDPAYADKLKDYCQRSGLAGKVRFTGFLDRAGMAALFARSNVLVFPSLFEEPFGITQVEAMASGLVVVTSGTGGASEIIRDGQDGLVFKANDPTALAGKLRLLAMEPAVFQRLQVAGQQRSLIFSVDASVRRIEELAADMIQSAIVSQDQSVFAGAFAAPIEAPAPSPVSVA